MTSLVIALTGTDHHPFERMVQWVDAAAERRGDVRFVVQHGSTRPPRVAEGYDFLSHDRLVALLEEAALVICHGGPGTIMDAREAGHVPLCIPRDPLLGEHVDGHQQRFASLAGGSGVVRLVSSPETFHAELESGLRAGAAAACPCGRPPRTGTSPGPGPRPSSTAWSTRTGGATGACSAPPAEGLRWTGRRGRTPNGGLPPGGYRTGVRQPPVWAHQRGRRGAVQGREEENVRVTTVYLGGFGRSGSTLVERMLGAATGWVNIGELVDLARSVAPADERCGCGQAFSSCPFWTAVGETAFGGWTPEVLARLSGGQRAAARQRHLPGLLAGRTPSGPLAELRADYARIYRAAAEVSGASRRRRRLQGTGPGPGPRRGARRGPAGAQRGA